MSKDNKLNIGALVGAIILTFLLIITGRLIQDTYQIKVGQISPKTIYAPREIQNKIATKNRQEHAADLVEQQYVIDPQIEDEAKEVVDLIFRYIDAVQSEEVTVYNVNPIELLKSRLPVSLYTEQYQLLLDMTKQARDALKQQIIEIVGEIFKAGVTSENQGQIMMGLGEIFDKSGLSIAQGKLGSEIVSGIIKPNMVIDHQKTQELIEETINSLDPVIVMSGEKIVEQGTKITEETYEILRSAGYIKEQASSNINRYLGVGATVILLAGVFAGYIIHKKKEIKLKYKEKSLLFVLYVMGIFITWVLKGVRFTYIPMSIIPMLVAILITSDIAILINIILVIVGALIYKGDLIYVLYFLITGTVSAISVIHIRDRNKTLSIATYLGLTSVAMIVSLRLFTQGTVGIELIKEAVGAFIISILMLTVVVGSLPFWETVFDVVTPIKLLELTNPNQELLKRLLLEATGTYHHSLLVANLAETAANAVGANPLLARVGGYYHDIGKLGYANYYKENQISENPHDHLEPALSAQIILSHVTRGEELAIQYKLPKYVRDIIKEHHGTTLAQYFYIKASNNQQAEEVDKKDFQYKGPKPQTKEAAIVMLADVVEATVRSIMPNKKSDETLEDIVAKIVRNKLEDGQLDESELMIRDIEKIIKAFIQILKGMYHDRIVYPTKEKG